MRQLLPAAGFCRVKSHPVPESSAFPFPRARLELCGWHQVPSRSPRLPGPAPARQRLSHSVLAPPGRGGALLAFAAFVLVRPGPCALNPCHNNAECQVLENRGDVFAQYICKCPRGYTGAHCETICAMPLGMESGAISDAQISASSMHLGFMGLQRWAPELARLHRTGIVNAWTSSNYDRNPWIQVNLLRKFRVTGVVTQGASRAGSAEYLKSFKVAYSVSGHKFQFIKTGEGLTDKVNVGPKKGGAGIPWLRCQAPGGCAEPLGMRDNVIPDKRITASSTYKTWGLSAFSWHPFYARLDRQGKFNAWTAQSNSASEWLQILPSPQYRPPSGGHPLARKAAAGNDRAVSTLLAGPSPSPGRWPSGRGRVQRPPGHHLPKPAERRLQGRSGEPPPASNSCPGLRSPAAATAALCWCWGADAGGGPRALRSHMAKAGVPGRPVVGAVRERPEQDAPVPPSVMLILRGPPGRQWGASQRPRRSPPLEGAELELG
ncbi:PREDICTED: lactadherin [Condylura cristata]|uniref:lactadherin n=1 Tax=Condylura cristata TaxID=143302 RepID=UPI0003345EEC|nr:PREDICTED: lactadherin [Condylura cristata]